MLTSHGHYQCTGSTLCTPTNKIASPYDCHKALYGSQALANCEVEAVWNLGEDEVRAEATIALGAEVPRKVCAASAYQWDWEIQHYFTYNDGVFRVVYIHDPRDCATWAGGGGPPN